jgi:uroporphyrinogen III methyltransferase/synthase
MAIEKKGKVYLVGAGPGDPGLITLKAKACIEKADVIVYDELANRVFLEFADEKAERIYVGKKGGCHAVSQAEINRLVIEKALEGLHVVRLKGGDPFIFGRGGEEAQELVRAGITFEAVPGVTSAIAVPAYAGIPLTHRDFTASVAFIAGHEDPAKEGSAVAWDKLATGAGTLVILMGVGNLPAIAKSLLVHGRDPETPVAVIQNGTVPSQRAVTAPLREIAERAEREGIMPPAVIVVGDVVRLRPELNWFEARPLFGKRILVTRAREQASGFLTALSELGAECIEFPAIEIAPPESLGPLDRAIGALDTYQWIVFTSVNGVESFFHRLDALGRDVRDLKGIYIAAIGPKTGESVRAKGIRVDLVPDEYRAEAMVEAFRKQEIRGKKVLLPRAAGAREILPQDLREMGARVDVVDAYRTVKPSGGRERIRGMLEAGEIHMVTFTSSSTVHNFFEMFEEEKDLLLQWMKRTAVACIGPVTAGTAEAIGLKVDLTPPEYTVEALTKGILDHFASPHSPGGGIR